MNEYKKPEAGEAADNESRLPVFLIGNPRHHLGFLVVSTDDPLGYTDPAEAISELGFLRKMAGPHLKLYRAVPVSGPIVGRSEVERFNEESCIEDFDFNLVAEYLE